VVRGALTLTQQKITCDNCGAPISNYANAEFVHCTYCGTDIAVKSDSQLADLVKEKQPHDFPDPQPPPRQANFPADHPFINKYQKRAQNLARGGVGWLANMIIARTIGACLPYLIVAFLIVAGVIGLIAWLIFR
jgi:DNA-directed RNA polymerase subunit RPC12/RpoP